MRYCGTAWHVYTVIIAEFRSFIITLPQWRRRRQGGMGAVKPCAPAVPRQLSYSDVDHKRIGWLRATDYFEDVNYNVIDHVQFLVCMADIR